MIVPKPEIEFELVIEQTIAGLDSENSKLQYRYTYLAWQRWCDINGCNVLTGLNMQNITLYLKDIQGKNGQPVSFTTRQNHLSHLKKLLMMLSIYGDFFKQRLEEVNYMKVPRAGAKLNRAEKHALDPEQVVVICTAWINDKSLRGIRNHAFINLTFATGARISEVSVVEWSHISEGVLTIPHGKGDKRRHATIVDDGIPVYDALNALWSERGNMTYAFSPTLKSGAWGADRPITRQAAANIINDTTLMTGIDFHHHLARFTLGTELLRNGGDGIVKDVMEQFGHSNAQTFLSRYAEANTAEKRRKRFKTGW